MQNSTLGVTKIIKKLPALVMSELPDTDVWTGEQRRKKTGRESKYTGMLTSRIQEPSVTS